MGTIERIKDIRERLDNHGYSRYPGVSPDVEFLLELVEKFYGLNK